MAEVDLAAVVAALANNGNSAQAGAALDLAATTVRDRLDRAEAQAGADLFARHESGRRQWVLTKAGRRWLRRHSWFEDVGGRWREFVYP